MIGLFLLAPLILLSTFMSMVAGVMAMLAAVFTLVIGSFVGAMVMSSTAFLSILIFILS